MKLTSLHTRYLRLEVLLFELKPKLLLKNLVFNFQFVANDKLVIAFLLEKYNIYFSRCLYFLHILLA